MISGLKHYPVMRASGVAWLGNVPSHWACLPGRACYWERKVPNTALSESTVLSLSYGSLVVKPPEKLHGLVPASFETYQIIESGDIVVRPTDLQNDWNSLRFALAKTRGIITSAYMCLQTKKSMKREYGHSLLHAYDLRKIFYGLGSGLRQNLDWRDFKYLPCVPPTTSRTGCDCPVYRSCRPEDSALHPRKAEADCAAGGGEAGHNPPSCHGPDRRSDRPSLSFLQEVPCGSPGEGSESLGGTATKDPLFY